MMATSPEEAEAGEEDEDEEPSKYPIHLHHASVMLTRGPQSAVSS